MIRARTLLILFAISLAACARQDKPDSIPATAPAPSATEAAAIISASPSYTPTRPADDIDARLTSIALTVHPQLTGTAIVMQPDLALTAGRLTPAPSSTFPASVPQMIYEAPEIRWAFWSPDSRWISFYVPPPDVEGFTINAVPVFYEVATGRTCMYEEFGGTMQYEYPTTYSYWQPDGYATLLVDGTPYAGLPCEEFVRAPDSYAISPWARSTSPDRRYEARVIYSPDDTNATLTITDLFTGAVVNEHRYVGFCGQGCDTHVTWLGSDLLLVHRSIDQGPLLITPGVLTELFDKTLPTDVQRAYAFGALDEITRNYHLLLIIQGPSASQEDPMLLYHSESGEIETIPFRAPSGITTPDGYLNGFSPDGAYLLLARPLEGRDDGAMWIRGVDDRKHNAVYIGRMESINWSGPTNRIAFVEPIANGTYTGDVVVATFPEMRVLNRWHIEGQMLTPWGWSPDGTKLLINSPYNEREPARLYLVEP